jgi:hypothetical protein
MNALTTTRKHAVTVTMALVFAAGSVSAQQSTTDDGFEELLRQRIDATVCNYLDAAGPAIRDADQARRPLGSVEALKRRIHQTLIQEMQQMYGCQVPQTPTSQNHQPAQDVRQHNTSNSAESFNSTPNQPASTSTATEPRQDYTAPRYRTPAQEEADYQQLLRENRGNVYNPPTSLNPDDSRSNGGYRPTGIYNEVVKPQSNRSSQPTIPTVERRTPGTRSRTASLNVPW